MEYLPKLVPNLRIANGVQSRHLSHDAAVVKAYDDDARSTTWHQRQIGGLYAGRRWPGAGQGAPLECPRC